MTIRDRLRVRRAELRGGALAGGVQGEVVGVVVSVLVRRQQRRVRVDEQAAVVDVAAVLFGDVRVGRIACGCAATSRDRSDAK